MIKDFFKKTLGLDKPPFLRLIETMFPIVAELSHLADNLNALNKKVNVFVDAINGIFLDPSLVVELNAGLRKIQTDHSFQVMMERICKKLNRVLEEDLNPLENQANRFFKETTEDSVLGQKRQ